MNTKAFAAGFWTFWILRSLYSPVFRVYSCVFLRDVCISAPVILGFCRKQLLTEMMAISAPAGGGGLRASVAFKLQMQQMKPWQFGLYGMPGSIQRKYASSGGSYAEGTPATTTNYEVNQIALEDLFYGLVTGCSPYVGDTRQFTNAPSTAEILSGSDHVQMMFRVHVHSAESPTCTAWLPLRMDGCGTADTMDPMFRAKCSAKDIITKVKSRLLLLLHDDVFQFLNERQIKVTDELVRRDHHKLSPSSPISGKVDGLNGCMSPVSPFSSMRVISFPLNGSMAGISLMPGANRGRMYAALPNAHIKPDRRRACDFVHVLSRFHVTEKTMNGSGIAFKTSGIRASTAFHKDVTLSNIWRTVASTLTDGEDQEVLNNVFTPDAILGSMIVNKAIVGYANQERDSAYSIDTDISFMDSNGNTITSSLLITVAVVDNSVNDKLPPPPLSTPTTVRMNKHRGDVHTNVRPPTEEKMFKNLVGWCKPMSTYVVRGNLTHVVINDAKNGSMWAKAFMAFVGGRKDETIQMCRDISAIIEGYRVNGINKSFMDRLETMMEDKSNAASILQAVSKKYGVDVMPVRTSIFM